MNLAISIAPRRRVQRGDECVMPVAAPARIAAGRFERHEQGGGAAALVNSSSAREPPIFPCFIDEKTITFIQ
ncbi:MAG: hypothetical protein JO166_07670 [Deltaproteobacteria bacterium]|nr:hypothetical protein [Deltaproteobacteria bacterium]